MQNNELLPCRGCGAMPIVKHGDNYGHSVTSVGQRLALNKPVKLQPPPTPNNSKPIWDLVIDDMKSRDHFGRKKYGTPLQAFNGRDVLKDAYEEALDMAVYLRQAIEEREASKNDVNY